MCSMNGSRVDRLAGVALVALVGVCGASACASSPQEGSANRADGGDVDADRDMAVDATASPVVDADTDDAGVPSIDQGLLTAIQGIPTPEVGRPEPFVLVGCPRGGYVEMHFYLFSETGVTTEVGRRVGRYSKTGIVDSIEVPDAGTSHIEIPEEKSFAARPFVYAATVTLDPSFLDTTRHTFVARMLNPQHPEMNDVGVLFPQKLVVCPPR